jgi:hypothetical protein
MLYDLMIILSEKPVVLRAHWSVHVTVIRTLSVFPIVR